MLPTSRRLRRPAEFSTAISRGVRAGRRTLVVHLAYEGSHRARAGFVVSKAVGNSVVRHRVTRQLRHLASPHLAELPVGTHLVVRALPAAAGVDSRTLGADLTSGLATARRKWTQRNGEAR